MELLSEIIDMAHLCCLFLFTKLPPLIDILLLQHVVYGTIYLRTSGLLMVEYSPGQSLLSGGARGTDGW